MLEFKVCILSIALFTYFGKEHVLGFITFIARHSEYPLFWFSVRERHDNIQGFSVGGLRKSFFSNHPWTIPPFLNFVGLFQHVISTFIGDGDNNLMSVFSKIQEFKIERTRFLN
ncbi:hypothetical protein SAMN04489841_3886 [Natrinema salaciae]|uniref:Uncharacterized protein n=1 Tax=Natrinema salaciae TaxID=1186196 RepID=A0A1H9P8E3_9EURY|nr:hypothetical protein SAMN04489841_3886 [Natrinema salaciae]